METGRAQRGGEALRFAEGPSHSSVDEGPGLPYCLCFKRHPSPRAIDLRVHESAADTGHGFVHVYSCIVVLTNHIPFQSNS